MNIKTITPFKCMCMTIGNLPTSYFESMSYYECLTYLVKFLEREVIPTVNNNSEVVKELQDYMEHYFDDLNIQEQINNKLEEMATSGELVEIIGAYFNAMGFIGFNTKADMVAADNLIDGTKCKTLGTLTYNDGFGETYLIRELEESDTIDGTNLVALTNFPELVAERIPDYYRTLLNISNFETPTLIGTTNITEVNGSRLKIATNGDGSIFKFYGYIKFSPSASGEATLTFSTSLRPSTAYTMQDVAIVYNSDRFTNNHVTVNTNGSVTLSVYVVDDTAGVWIELPACLYFNKDFGDSPS